MGLDITIKIGGEAGQGIQTVGNLLTLVCHKAGLYVMGINDFESRIRGGHCFFQLRISNRPVSTPQSQIHLLVALNQETVDFHQNELVPDGLILSEQNENHADKRILNVPFEKLAKKAGDSILANTVAAGACLGLLGAPFDLFKTWLSEQFEHKGSEVLIANTHAAELGHQSVKDVPFKWSFEWNITDPKGIIIDGSKAFALGAIAGDCRFGAFYPMSPATGIMTYLSDFSKTLPLVIEQAEDEIAAANMIIGAAFAGVRAITATSGGGFSLMTEALGLAAITETPMVIINAQRPGPATGLPTRTAQGDLHFMIHASQDEFPRFIFAPGNPQQAYHITARALYLSEKYQVPVIILSDQYLNDSLFILEPFKVPAKIERFIVYDEDMKNPAEYQRFKLTPSGISPRALPGIGEALVIVSSDEHREDGHISEQIAHRVQMVDKRKSKIPAMLNEMNPPEAYYPDAEFFIVGWGSTYGSIRESVDILREQGVNIGALHFVDLWPFGADAAASLLEKCSEFYMVENNSTAQLGQLIRAQTGLTHAAAVLKYDGRPFFPSEIVSGIKNLLK